MSQLSALVCGGNGFIGHHLSRFLKSNGYNVCVADNKQYEYGDIDFCDQNILCDLRDPIDCDSILKSAGKPFDLVFQLAADMGGMGFIHSAECDIMHNNVLINTNMIDAAVRNNVKKYFFSSSVCVYRDMKHGEPEMSEDEAIPANPDNEYGWEKLYSERTAMAYGRKYGITVRIARFQNCYGPEGTWHGGREKAPAAMCRKIAEANNPDTIEIWGDGSAVRSYTYVNDMVNGIYRLMYSNITSPVNIGDPTYYSVNDLVKIVADVAGKKITTKSIPGPVGVQSRNFSNNRIYATGWKPSFKLRDGIKETYSWILNQVQNAQS